MKKLFVTAALALAVVSAYSQGTVIWGNSASTLVSTNSYAGQGTAPAGSPSGVTAPSPGTGYVYGLFTADKGTANGGMGNTAWRFTGLYATNTTAVSGGRYGAIVATLTGIAPGTEVALQIRGWSASFGKDWTAVKAWGNPDAGGVLNVAATGWYGESAIATITLGGGALPNASLYGTGSGQLSTGFLLNQVNPIPEPSTFALAGLAGAALLIFRRRS